MSILNVNQIQPVGSGQTVTISAANITASSSTISASSFVGGVTVTSGNLTGISSVSTTNLTVNGNAYPNAGPLSNRNLIINGSMQVAQRGTSDTGFTSSSYMADRFRINVSNMGTWDGANSSTSPSGFTNSCRFDCTTADASPAAADFVNFKQIFEGQNLQHLKYGTASAESLTLSFWVRSNKTGTYTVELDRENADFNSISYSISSADTWEYKTVTFSGLTSSSIPNDNTEGLKINWWLGGGSNYSSGTQTNNTWHTTTANRLASGQVNLADSTSNEWYITGVQLETGSVATPFEHRSYGDELARCQRYYYKLSAASNDRYFMGLAENSTVFYGVMHSPVTMRTDPTLETSGTATHFKLAYSTDTTCNALPTLANSTQNTALIGGAIVASGLTANQAVMLASNSASSYLALTAEL